MAQTASVAHIPDSNLKAALRQALCQPNGDITTADLATLTSLNLNEQGITDLTGLEHAVNLQYLDFYRNQVSDLTPLARLVNLYYMYFDNTQVSDLTSLARLVNLRGLSFYYNQVSDLTTLAGLVNLQGLPQIVQDRRSIPSTP